MTEPKDAIGDAEARTQHDPVVFGPDPFDQQPGWQAPAADENDDPPAYLPRPKWPMVTGILILVVLMVGALGIWVF